MQITSLIITPSIILSEYDDGNEHSMYAFGTVMYLASVLGVLGYLLVLHESLEYLGISRLVDFLITLSRLQAMPGLAKRRKEKIQHVMECFDYPNCVREFAGFLWPISPTPYGILCLQ